MRVILKITIALIILSFIAAAIFYPIMPALMASHWDFTGNVNGYLPKVFALFIIPVISLLLFLLFIYLPRLDPFRNNYKAFSKYYEGFILVFVAFMTYIYAVTLALNLGISFNMIMLISPAFAIFFFYLGILLENAKRNWFVGIRTPWTLSSEKVWNQTHSVGGKLFKVSALLSLLGLVFPNLAVWFIILPILVSAIFVIVYSYFLFKRK